MAQPTNYKRTVSGSIGSGVKSVFGKSGRRYYILEHKVSSKYHQAGESQRIIVDEIEIGETLVAKFVSMRIFLQSAGDMQPSSEKKTIGN